MRSLLIALVLVALAPARANDGPPLAVSAAPAPGGALLVSARAGAGELGPGAVRFALAGAGSSNATTSGAVHLGIAQAVLPTPPCEVAALIIATYEPAAGGTGASGSVAAPAC
jgi:hypothetical protein